MDLVEDKKPDMEKVKAEEIITMIVNVWMNKTNWTDASSDLFLSDNIIKFVDSTKKKSKHGKGKKRGRYVLFYFYYFNLKKFKK